MGSIDLLDPLPYEILLQLVIHDLGRQHEGDFAQLGELAFLFMGVEHRWGSALGGAGHILGRRVNDFDFVGFEKERFRHRLLGAPAADRFDLRLLLSHVLEVNGGDHGDSRGQELLDLLPALRVLAPGGVLISETVDQTDLRVTAEDRSDIDRRGPEIGLKRNDFEMLQELLHFRGSRGLDGGHDHILAAHFAAASFVQHSKRFANTRGVTEEHLELSAHLMVFFGFNPLEKLLGTGPAMFPIWHKRAYRIS